MAKQWGHPLHINAGELRPALTWLHIAGKAFDLRRIDLFDISDNQGTACLLAHGRSSSPFLNPILEHRIALDIVTGAHLASTWTSTCFQPPDAGTRLGDGDALLGNVFRQLFVVCRLILVGGFGAKKCVERLKEQGWPGVVWFTPGNGRELDFRANRGKAYLHGLSVSGRVVAQLWWITGH